MKIVFFGTSCFAAQILSYLVKQNDIEVLAVVTRIDRPRGRSLQTLPPPVKELLLQNSLPIPCHQPIKASNPDFCNLLKRYDADLFVVVAYGEILKQQLLSIPRLGCINIHASLLPKYRGAAPIHRALMAGEASTGITIIDMVLEMDAGDMIDQAKMTIPSDMNFGALEEKLVHIAQHSILRVIHQFGEGKVARKKQNLSEVTFAPKLTSQEEEIDWNRTAVEIHNQIRALAPFPGAWCWIAFGNERKRLKIKQARVIQRSGNPKEILVQDNALIVACKEGALELLQVQLEGKKEVKISDFLNGLRAPLLFIS